jgi:hypothetical protein
VAHRGELTLRTIAERAGGFAIEPREDIRSEQLLQKVDQLSRRFHAAESPSSTLKLISQCRRSGSGCSSACSSRVMTRLRMNSASPRVFKRQPEVAHAFDDLEVGIRAPCQYQLIVRQRPDALAELAHHARAVSISVTSAIHTWLQWIICQCRATTWLGGIEAPTTSGSSDGSRAAVRAFPAAGVCR